jgi:PAS domain-containing protein
VEFLRKYTPHHTRYLTALSSPLLAHARLLRNLYGDDIGIVFIGPCIAKKLESDNHPELVNVALTFEDLRRWFEQAQIDPASLTEGPEDVFIPRRSREGALYPVEGGMIDSIRAQYPKLKTQWVSFSGVRRFEKALAGLEQLSPDENLFLELLSCYGGCVNGPKSSNRVATVCKRYNISQYALPAEPLTAEKVLIADSFPPAPVEREIIPEAKLREVLKLVGKFTEKDELNCGGCGYDSCREFARAFLHDKAERTMCVTYMRALAQKKANVLIQKIPSAIVIVDQSLKIVECNPHFAKLFGPPVKADSELPILEGTPLDTALPFIRIFESVLRSGEDMIEKDLRFKGRILHALIFNIEKGSLVGALFEDITKPAMHREQIVKRARHVIQQNLKTVQNIAYLLGENAADSEIILNSIVESYKPEEEEPPAV